MDSRARAVIRLGEKLFADKNTIDSLWQELAWNFYPERAEFTTTRDKGEEFADHLFSSYPVIARRELGNQLDEFLFPDKFFSIHVDDEEIDEADEERQFLERLTEIQWRAMTDPVAQLVKARGQTNHDIATFGNGVLKFGLNLSGDALLFRNYHLRDCTWTENAEGVVDCLYRKWKPTARQLEKYFPKTISENVKKVLTDGPDKDPDSEFECFHAIMPSRLYDYKTKGGKRFPFTSLYVEIESETVLEETGLGYFCYVVPRWQIVSGSVFGSSMATAAILPDGRTMQVVMRTLREAGEMHVNPPMLAFTDAIRGDIAMYPGGVTTSDIEYDGKLADVLRPITRDKSGFPIGEEIAKALKEDIRSGFLLDKMALPETYTGKMTATEVRRRTQEFIRAASPISKPLHLEYNFPLCDGVFQVMRENNGFPFHEMPESLADKDIKFKFRTPLDELTEENEAHGFVAGATEILAPLAQIDPSVLAIANLHEGARDSLRAYGWKAKWLNPREEVEAKQEEVETEQKLAKLAQFAGTAGQVAEQGGKGLGALVNAGNAAMQPPPQPGQPMPTNGRQPAPVR